MYIKFCYIQNWDVKLTTHLHLVPRSKNEWSYISTPQYVFMAWCLVKSRDKFYLFVPF
jgi:hypothetical protein